jgi:hypothetical protein
MKLTTKGAALMKACIADIMFGDYEDNFYDWIRNQTDEQLNLRAMQWGWDGKDEIYINK